LARHGELDLFGNTEPAIRCGQVETWAREQGFELLLGLDEAGRGPLAGPVVAAAVVLPAHCTIEGLDDSKRLSERQREALFDPIQSHAIATSIASVEAPEIDSMNILRASLHAMALSWEGVMKKRPDLTHALVLVDGNQRAPLPDHVEQRPIVKGDAKSLNIAAASILAKVTRDRLMCQHHERWPVYGFDRHKGYPTAAHAAAIREHGPCPIHRKSFRVPGA
jgi:ribonuclease HII